FQLLAVIMIGGGIALFFYFLGRTYQQRIRRKTDDQIKLSLAAVGLLMIPLVILLIVLYGTDSADRPELVIAYGFSVFFGWITAIILGMTFKTLPFIVWNRVYRHQSSRRKTPDPKSLFSHTLFKAMFILYGLGFAGVFAGILTASHFLIQGAAFLM